ncbi:hypothetical protein [Winogradskyella psychrotolerans]|uniref:hypothetical protein n=1 Tax=Winogradskyella psychrotolerans TaxID=1344585 RepID=UPI001C073089|nr:hypothetical protein [Winogradskyella psychrotolerans]MBU2929302.1 hypothetical protein [Winogradskyella psychrotolerans]
MTKKEEVYISSFKKAIFIDSLFYISFLAAILVSVCLDRSQLIYALPVVILTILIKYISRTKKSANPIFILALLAILISDILSFRAFEACFPWIAISSSIYLLCCTFSLKKYLQKGTLKSVLSFSVILSGLLVFYITYAIVDLLIDFLAGFTLFFVFLIAASLIIQTIAIAIIYIRDTYHNGTILLASGIFTFFQITLIAINEFLYFDNTFTVLIVICHVMAIYLLMHFISTTAVVNPEDLKEKFI